jgi:pimeloyl-ACP methyl ester carboxylesterase
MNGSQTRVNREETIKQSRKSPRGQEARERLLAGLPVTERRRLLGGVSTAMLEGGQGPPMILLHGPGEYAAKWMRVIPELAKENRVIAPDLPGHGASKPMVGEFDVSHILAWLDDLIEETCEEAPILVGQVLGGAIAARFAVENGERLRHLVLVDALGLTDFQPAPEFGSALERFIGDPTEATHEELWQRCAYDLHSLRNGMGERWAELKAYNLDRAGDTELHATQQRLMMLFGFPAISNEDLARISVPTTLIWGRHDLATAVAVAEAVSARFDWPLHIVEDAADDPPLEQPEAFLRALHA